MSDDIAQDQAAEVETLLAAYQAACAAGRTHEAQQLLGAHPEVTARLQTLAATPPPRGLLDETLFRPSDADGGAAGAPTLDQPGHAPAAELPRRPREFGDYDLLEEVARGGMGVVYKARQKSLNRVVALKMILAGHLASAEQVNRFRIEAEEAGRLEHPNIVPIHQVGCEQGQHYFTMKLMEGGNLNEHMAEYQNDPEAASRLLAAVARAVHYAHQHGIIHRDLKPGNILLDAMGEPHVTDFGLAKHLSGRGSDTRSGVILGTPSYMAPEQAAAKKDLSTAADVYSLGAILYELLCGRPPFLAASHMETLREVMEKDPVRPRQLKPKLDRDLETICLTCLAKEPGRRYAGADGLARDLDRYLAREPIRARPVGPWERTIKWVRRRPAAAALLAVSFLAVVSLTVLGWWYSAHLKKALTETDRARREAQEKSQLLLNNYHQRVDVVDDILNRIDGRLAHMDRTGRLRLEVLGEAERWSLQLLEELPDDPMAQTQLARIYRSIGDVYASYHEFRDAGTWYEQALEKQQELASRFADEPTYRNDLAVTAVSQARMLAHTGRLPQARQACRRAIGLEDGLAKETRAHPEYARRAARYTYRLGILLEDENQSGQAEAAYHDALKRQTKLMQDWGRKPEYLADYATTSRRLGLLVAETDPTRAQTYLEEMLKASRDAFREAPQSSTQVQDLQRSYDDLADWYRRHGRHAELAHVAQDYRRDFPEPGNATYNVACLYADALQATQRSRTPAVNERQKLSEKYGTEAMSWLQRSIQEGYADRVHIDVDRDLMPLRGRADFQKLCANLDQRHPVAPAREYEALAKEYALARGAYDRQREEARTKAQKAEFGKRRPPFEDFAPHFLALADKGRESSTGVRALLWVLYRGESGTSDEEDTRPPVPFTPEARELVKKAVDMLARDHLQGAEFATVCQSLIETPQGEADDLLRKAAAHHPQTEIRAQATYALALSLASQAQQARKNNPGRADSFAAEAEQQLTQLIQHYAGVTQGRSTLGEMAKSKLYEIQHLMIGRTAPLIDGKDLDGRPLRLADYRGRVVMLDFWANWCGWCRQMYPHERQLVQRMQGRPFVLLGVNCDDNLAAARQAVARDHLTWKSWADGPRGPIDDRWQVDGFPTVYLLDGKGIIRHRFSGTPDNAELDTEVEKLVKEQEKAEQTSKPRP